MTARKIYTFRLNDTTPEDHLGRLGEITYRDGFLYYHDGATAGGELIGGGSGGSGGPTSWASVTGKPSFATVATSGSYADLTGKPTLFSGSYNDLTDTPTLTTGPQGAAGATGEPGAQGPQGERAEEDRLVNGAQEVVLDSDGTLTTPAGLSISKQLDGSGVHIGSSIQSDLNKNLRLQTLGTGSGSLAWQNFEGDANFVTLNYNQSKNIMISVGNAVGEGTLHNWLFASTGNIQLPPGGDIVDIAGNSVLGGGSSPTNEITNTSPEGSIYSVSVGTDGVVTMTTARGGIEFGAMPEVGGPSHLHIMRPAGQNSSTDLYFGDDYNYVKMPGLYGSNPTTQQGVEIGSSLNEGVVSVWKFGTDGKLTTPAGLEIYDESGFNGISSTGGLQIDNTGLDQLRIIWNLGENELPDFSGADVRAVGINAGVTGLTIEIIDATDDSRSWNFRSNGILELPQGGDIVDNLGNSVLGGGSSADTGDIVFVDGILKNTQDQIIKLQTQSLTQTASYNFTPQGGDYSTAVWDGTNITFNDPTQAIYDAIWALTDVSVIEVQVGSTWYTVTSGGSSTPGMPAAPTLFVNESAVGGPLNIDNVQITINQGTTSYVEIDGTDFRVDVQDDIRMYANDIFRLSNKSSNGSINIETNDGDHTWYFKADGNLQLPSGGTIVDGDGTNLLGGFSGAYADLSGLPTLFDGDYNTLTNKPTIRIAVPTGSGPGGNLQADSLALAGLNPVTDIPSTWGGDLILQGGVGGANGDLYGEVRIKSGQIGANYEWHFTTDKKIKLPAGGSIVDSTGTSVLGGSGSYAPAVPANWASPAPTTIAEALNRIAAKLLTLGGDLP